MRSVFIQLPDILMRLDLKLASAGVKEQKLTSFITVTVESWPIGFMFNSNGDAATVCKVMDKDVLAQGLLPGHKLELLNGHRVGHMDTEKVLHRMTMVEFPLTLKFIETSAFKSMTNVPKSIEVGIKQQYTLSDDNIVSHGSQSMLTPNGDEEGQAGENEECTIM